MEEQINNEIFLLSENNHPLDKAFELYQISYKQNDWKDAERIADYMYETANSLYKNQQSWAGILPMMQLSMRRPLVFYFGYSFLAKAIAFQKQGLYDEARKYTAKYAELDWFEDLDRAGQEEVERFKIFAKANSYAVDLLSGNLSVLDTYNDYIQKNDEEVLPGLITILEAANLNEWNIDILLSGYIPQEIETFASYEDIGNRVYYIKLLNQLAIYNLNHQRYSASINYTLDYLLAAVKMNVDKEFITTVAMYDTIRSYATVEQQAKYNNILKGVLSGEKKINSVVYGNNIS